MNEIYDSIKDFLSSIPKPTEEEAFHQHKNICYDIYEGKNNYGYRKLICLKNTIKANVFRENNGMYSVKVEYKEHYPVSLWFDSISEAHQAEKKINLYF